MLTHIDDPEIVGEFFSTADSSSKSLHIASKVKSDTFRSTQWNFYASRLAAWLRHIEPDLNFDFSSVYHRWEAKSETTPKKAISDEALYSSMLKHDLIGTMPPKRKYTAKVRIVEIKKAVPRPVEPEDL